MITSEQAKQYLQSQGAGNTPDFILDAWVEQANSIQECLEEHYTANTALLIQCYLISLFALGASDKFISSQTASSGASRSFKYRQFSDKWKAQLNLLTGLDKSGCATDLIPSNPTQSTYAGIWISKGGCMGKE